MSAVHEHTINIVGFRTTLRVVGDGPCALVLFPAVAQSAATFGRLQLRLRHRLGSEIACVAVDPPGYGADEPDSLERRPVPGFKDWPEFCAALSHALQQRFDGGIVFAGNSSGAVAATYCALAASQADGRLGGGLGLLCWCDWRHTQPRTAELLCPETPAQLEHLQRLSWCKPPTMNPTTISAATRSAARYRAHVASFDAAAYRAVLASYSGPLLVVAGDSDGLVPEADARATAYAHRDAGHDASFHTLPDCGHYPHREQPSALADVLADFTRAAIGQLAPLQAPAAGAAPSEQGEHAC